MPSKQNWTRRKVLFSIFSGSLAIGLRAFAQDNVSTPTLGPTKTPSPTPAAVPPPTTIPLEEGSGFQSLTQSDLSVITANVQRPNGIVWHNNFLYTACTGDSTVYEINSQSGQTRTYIFGVFNAHSFYAEGEGNNLTLWTPDFEQNTLARVTRNGVEEIIEDLNGPWGIAYEDDEHFLITNLLGNSLIRASREGEAETLIDTLASPTGIARDGSIVYIANNGSTRRAIEWYDLDALDDEDENHLLVSGLQNTTGLQIGSDGYLYFAYSIGTRGVIGRVNPATCRENGGCTNEQVEVVVFTELRSPLAGLSVSPDMRLFIHTMFIPDIYWVQLPGGENSGESGEG
jgi:hypothetical protein